jgi:transcriptional regulator with XRE-family HTH domain
MEETLGRRIRRARLHRDITQKDLAGLVGISRNAMNKLEKGETLDPRMTHLRKIAEALGVSMDYLAGRKDDDVELEPTALVHAGREA